VIGAEECGQSLASEVFHLVDDVVAAVVTTPWIPFGVLIGQD